jgi:enoyl-CoA hydratase/carnithine racemase
MTAEIEIELKDGVQLLRFRRPEKKNALTAGMYQAMGEALDRGETSSKIAVHVFIGSGGVFSAGNDINDFLRRAAAIERGEEAPTPSLDFVRRLPKVTKPMIAAVDGLAVGVGTTLLLHCDLSYASPAARFRTPFLDLGLIQEAGSSVLAPRRLGYARAFELLCLGETFDAERALQAGLINAIVPTERLEPVALQAAQRLAAKPRAALAVARRLLRGDCEPVITALEEEARAYRELLRTAEAKEALTAFLEKRPPDFAKLRKSG